jgi:hypothetical protein
VTECGQLLAAVAHSLIDASNGRVVHASKLDATLKIVPQQADARADKASVEAPGQASVSGA